MFDICCTTQLFAVLSGGETTKAHYVQVSSVIKLNSETLDFSAACCFDYGRPVEARPADRKEECFVDAGSKSVSWVLKQPV